MALFTGLAAERGIFSGGTFSGNPLTMEAGAAMLTHLSANPEIYVDLEHKTQRLASSVNDYCQRNRLPAQMKHVASMFHLFFQRGDIRSMRDVKSAHLDAERAFYLHCLDRGVLVPGTQRAFLSAAHSDREIEGLIDTFVGALADVAAEGLFEG